MYIMRQCQVTGQMLHWQCCLNQNMVPTHRIRSFGNCSQGVRCDCLLLCQWRAIGRAQALHHAMDAGDVVVGAADKLEEALHRVLPQHPCTCPRLGNMFVVGQKRGPGMDSEWSVLSVWRFKLTKGWSEQLDFSLNDVQMPFKTCP